MERLFTFLLSGQNAESHLSVIAIAILTSALAIFFLSRQSLQSRESVLAFGATVTLAEFGTFFDTFWSTHSSLWGTSPEPATVLSGLVIWASATGAGWLYRCHRRTIKSVILAGSVLAFGMTFSAFYILSAAVEPGVVAYDLWVVLFVLVLSATLCGFAFWELGSQAASRPRLVATALLALALTLLPLGCMGSVLPFDQWLTLVQQPDSALFSPLAVLCLSGFTALILLFCLASLLDIRVAIAQRQEGDRMRHLADGTFEGLLICRNETILDANNRIQEMLGLDLSQLQEKRLSDLFQDTGSKQDHVFSAGDQLRMGNPAQREMLGPNGRRIPVEVLSRELPYVDGEATIVAVRDVTERKAAEEHIRYLALHDSLTSLPNRRALESVLGQILEKSHGDGPQAAILGLDLDGFKAVNDTLGHHAGDLLLREVAERFQSQLRDSDYIARIGGDEFVIVLRGVTSPADAQQLAQRLLASLWQPFKLGGHDAYVGVSIGIAICPRDGHSAQMLLKCADIAMYQAKLAGKGQVCEFQRGMDVAVRERHDLELELRAAISRHELMLYYQPLFGRDGKIIGFEALARWPHPHRGMIPPDRFIPLAEESGLIVPLGEWVMRTACSVAVNWPSDLSIAVNLSPTQFQRVDLVGTVRDILHETGLAPSRLELEVTENLLMEDVPRALALVKDLRALGVRVALDDFGTGYSSLAYLHDFPFDKVKVDRSFINKITNDANAWTIVESIIVMSHKLKLRVTAEGIETGAQLELLTDHDCDEMQGFLLGRPMPEEEASRLAEVVRQDCDVAD
ncbi:diguanylate cyclase [Acetobacter estunensis NRIC 0472]|uniref:EAL domain-containing protein n=1 Tax=Acetobacter estunensis TaxID=104097 RepID=A0A967B5G8_9PROT|nr:GGDEF and EAL domain-containing protein [Acetobacter estunensis]NHO52774.1 EAL domain-containing protein [Acetobacter estunensis]GBQ28216.1 diguanylate cyclase [Acetobacter estunensis NRIC 0472]